MKHNGGRSTYADVVVSRRSHVGYGASVFRRQHDLVPDEGVLVHHTVDVPSCDVTAHLTAREETRTWMKMTEEGDTRFAQTRTRRLLLGENSHFRSRFRAPMFTPLGM